jgi:hypothetical protein
MREAPVQPYRLTTTRALGRIIVYTDPETPSGVNWVALEEPVSGEA